MGQIAFKGFATGFYTGLFEIASLGATNILVKFGKKVGNSRFVKVVLGSDDLSRTAIQFRKTLDTPNHRGNVAVFEYVDNNGVLVKKAFTTMEGNVAHAEEHARSWFETNNIPKRNVRRIYSELEPCELEGHACKKMLQKEFSGAQMTYSYDYPGGRNVSAEILEIRRTAIQQRFDDLTNLLK